MSREEVTVNIALSFSEKENATAAELHMNFTKHLLELPNLQNLQLYLFKPVNG